MATPVTISFFIGLILTSILFGTTVGQSGYYFSVYHRDTRAHHLLVVILMILDTLHMVVLSVAAYYTLLSWINPSYASHMTKWSFPSSIAITYILTFIVQAFFLWRIWILSRKNKLLSLSISLLALLQLVSGFVAVADVSSTNPLLGITSLTKLYATIELSSRFAADLAIFGTLVFFLNRGRSSMDHALATNSVLNRLILFAISTGLMTSIATMTNLALFVATPNTFYWVIPHVVSSKLYVCSTLATLNSRRRVRDIFNNPNSSSQFLPGTRPVTPSTPALMAPISVKLDFDSRESTDGGHSSQFSHSNSRSRGRELLHAFVKKKISPVEECPDSAISHELAPPAPIEESERDHSGRSRRELLSLIFNRNSMPTLDVAIPSGRLSPTPSSAFAASRFSITVTSPTRAKQGAEPRRVSRASYLLSPVTPSSTSTDGNTPASAWGPSFWRRSAQSYLSASAQSALVPSIHSSRLTARTFNTCTQTIASLRSVVTAKNPLPVPIPTSFLPSLASTAHASRVTANTSAAAGSLPPGDAFVNLSSIAAARASRDSGVRRIAGINERPDSSIISLQATQCSYGNAPARTVIVSSPGARGSSMTVNSMRPVFQYQNPPVSVDTQPPPLPPQGSSPSRSPSSKIPPTTQQPHVDAYPTPQVHARPHSPPQPPSQMFLPPHSGLKTRKKSALKGPRAPPPHHLHSPPPSSSGTTWTAQTAVSAASSKTAVSSSTDFLKVPTERFSKSSSGGRRSATIIGGRLLLAENGNGICGS